MKKGGSLYDTIRPLATSPLYRV